MERGARSSGTKGTRTLEISAAPVRDADGAIVSAVAILADVTRRSRAEENLRFLSRANELLVASLDWEHTLAAIAELAVPALAGYLVIDLVDEEDELHWVVAVHADPDKTELVRNLRASYPPTLSAHPIQVALRTGQPQLLPDLQAEAEAMAHDAKHARAIRRIANTSGLVAPLIARGRTLGTISLGTIEDSRASTSPTSTMARSWPGAISLALDNARLFAEAQERAHAAEALEYVDDGVFLVDERRHRPALEPDRSDQPPAPRRRGGRPPDRGAARRLAVAPVPHPGRLRAAGGEAARPDAAGRGARARSGGSRSPPSGSPAARCTRSAT